MDVEAVEVQMCRLCMAEDDVVFFGIFDSDVSTEESVVSKMWNCLNLKVFFGDGLPYFICHQCLYKLNRFNSFREVCHASYIHLRKSQCSSFVQDTIHQKDLKVESVVKIVSPVPFDTGCAVDSLEETYDEDRCEYVGNEMGYVADRGDTFSRVLFSHNSDESQAGLEEPQTICASDALISPQEPYDHLQSVRSKSDASAPDRSSLVLSQPSCTNTNHSASSQILNILKVNSDMILFPANDVLNNESSSISAILPMDNKSYSNTSSAEYRAGNRSPSPLALQTGGCIQFGTLTIATVDVPMENEGKLHMGENHVKVQPRLKSTLSSSECMTARQCLLNSENFKECRIDSEENINSRKRKLCTAASNTKCKKYSNKISQRHDQAVNMSGIPKTHKHSCNHAFMNFNSDSGKECELAAQTVSVENNVPSECCAYDSAVLKNDCFKRHVRKHLAEDTTTRNMQCILEEHPRTFNSIRKFEMHNTFS